MNKALLKLVGAALVASVGLASACTSEKSPPAAAAPVPVTQKETPPTPPAKPETQASPAKPEPSAKATPELIEKGRALYEGQGRCVSCHGPDGVAILEIPSMPNFSDPLWEKKEKDAQIITALEDGKDLMPPYAGQAADFPALIAYVRSLSGKAAGDAPKRAVRRGRTS